MPNYTKRTVRGVASVFFTSVLAAVIAFSTRIILARSLTPTEYGLFYAVFGLLSFFLFFRDLGIHIALIKYVPEFKVKKKFDEITTAIFSVATFQLASSLIIVLVFFLLADFLALNYFKNPAAKDILLLLFLYVIGSVFSRLVRSSLNGLQNIKVYSFFEPLKNLTILLLLLLFFSLGFGLYAPVYAYVLVCYVVVIILFPFVLKTFPLFKYKIKNFLPVTKKLFLFGIPVFATSFSGKFISRADTLILTYYRELSEVGVYNAILPSAMLFLYFASSVTTVIFPMISELLVKNDQRRISEGLRLLYRYSFVVIIPPAISIMIFSSLLISTFFGIEYVNGTSALQILILGMLVYVVAGINNSIISATGRPKTVAKIIFLVAVFNVITNFLLIPSYGIEGAALTTSLSYLIALILSTNRVIKYTSVKFPKDIWLNLVFAGLTFFTVAYCVKKILIFNPWIEFSLSIILAGIFYLAIIYYLKVIDVQEIKKYYKILRK